mmetsp:Transcript_135004/g.320057  ORF Transcript_135004/g.320057 Transcript_135004/m.320057 type:complete len:536 (-) Transcript_135004:624-2231(-)
MAVGLLLLASLRFMQRPFTCKSTTRGRHGNLSGAESLVVAVQARPRRPGLELAIPADATSVRTFVVVIQPASAHLLQSPATEWATAQRLHHDLPAADVPATTTRTAANSPGTPLREFASFKRRALAASCFAECTFARLPTVLWLLQHLSGTRLLNLAQTTPITCILVAAGPAAPLGKLAIPGNLTISGTVLRLLQGAETGMAALVVHGQYSAVPFAQANTGWLVPLAPGPKRAVPGFALILALRQHWALAHIQLRRRATGCGWALEDELGRSQWRCVDQGHDAVPHGGRSPAARPAGGIGPGGPGAVLRLVAVAVAAGDLSSTVWMANLATLVGHLHYASVPEALTSAPGAVAPCGPRTPFAILTINRRANFSVARLGDRKDRITGLSTPERLVQDFTPALLLATAAGEAALGPLAPLRELTVLWQRLAAGTADLVIIIASFNHFQRFPVAWLSAPKSEGLDEPASLSNAEAGAAALGPARPHRELAIRVSHTWGKGAALELLAKAANRVAAVVGLLLHQAGSRAVATGAAGRTG